MSQEPPLKKRKTSYPQFTINKNDKINTKITQLLNHYEQTPGIMVNAQGAGIQKMITIVEIVKSRIEGYEQWNKLDKYDTVLINDVLDKKSSVGVMSVIIRKNGEVLEGWNRQI
jgi:peptide deformylase